MLSYLRAKVVEWDIKLKGLKRELDGLGSTFPRVVHRLVGEYNQLKVFFNQLKRFVSILERLQTNGLTNIVSQLLLRASDQLRKCFATFTPRRLADRPTPTLFLTW